MSETEILELFETEVYFCFDLAPKKFAEKKAWILNFFQKDAKAITNRHQLKDQNVVLAIKQLSLFSFSFTFR